AGRISVCAKTRPRPRPRSWSERRVARVVGVRIAAAWVTSAVIVAIGCAACPAAGADLPSVQPGAQLTVGTFAAPPFVIKNGGGEWSGVASDLWREVARRRGFAYRLQEYDVASLLQALEERRVDVAVGPLLITADRARRIDPTAPFMHVALAIGSRPLTGWENAVRSVVTGPVVWAGLGL